MTDTEEQQDQPLVEPSRVEPSRLVPVHPDLVWRESVSGRHPGDRMLRVAHHRVFRKVAPGVLVPNLTQMEPESGVGKTLVRAKRVLIGQPIPTDQEHHERLAKIKALAILSSDALSSVAYGGEAIMRTLLLAGVGALSLTMPISIVITGLLAIVAISYQQVIRAYPAGGGSYIVARENLGTVPGLTAGAALLADYVLTVAVSIAAGVAAITSAFEAMRPYALELSIGAVILVMLVNLRGLRETGTIFAAPTYVFVASMLGLIAIGIWRVATGGIPYEPGPLAPGTGSQTLGWFLILAAFTKGCTAMTGTEAIADSVPAFKAPESRNARITLACMAGLLGVMFLGISYLVTSIGVVPDANESETVVSQLGRLIVGEGPYYYVLQFSTALILFLAANTSYTGFPRLLSIMARDHFAPHWFGLRGDRLAFTFGIAALTVAALAILAIFGSSVDKLLPLYAVGVFTGFTLSQAGMVVHWLKGREPNRTRNIAINGLGAITTGIVTAVTAYTKFLQGAWIIVVVIVIMVLVLLAINRHYRSIARQLKSDEAVKPMRAPLVLVPVSNLSRATRQALSFALGLSGQVLAVHIGTDPQEMAKVKSQWDEVVGDVPLILVESPYRFLFSPLLAYVDALRKQEPDVPLLVLLPQFVPRHWWENLLHNQTALRLKTALAFRRGIVVASVPYHLDD